MALSSIIADITKLRQVTTLTDREIINDLLQPCDNDADFANGNNNYIWFWILGAYFRPKIIFEMGVRFGYSTKSFVDGAARAANDYRLFAYDGEVDGIASLDIFLRYFAGKGIPDITVIRKNTRLLTYNDMPTCRTDLALVDAEHSKEGCLNECLLSWSALGTGGVLIVDDADTDDVKAGVEEFSRTCNVEFGYLPSFRGITIAIK